MTLPPERITVKRRRDEDPIEALFIQQKKYRPSAIWKLVGNENDEPQYAKSIASSIAPQISHLSPSNSSQIPAVRTTLPSEDDPKQSQDTFDALAKAQPRVETKKPSSMTRPFRNGQDPRDNTSEPRKFHLTKSSLKISSPYLVSKTSAQKHIKARRNELAVFVEAGTISKAKTILQSRAPASESARQLGGEAQEDLEGRRTPRKRPNATAIERKWREENWDKPTTPRSSIQQRTKTACHANQPSHEWNYESPELAAQLQQIAFQESEIQSSYPLKDHSNRRQLKVMPKPPKPRQPVVNVDPDEKDGDDVMADVVSLDNDFEYVFDTYVRTITQPSHTNTNDLILDPSSGVHGLKMGVLIIDDGEEEELWETFGEDVDSDPEWNSEEEDENAEDFYGNDYPEDEVHSDDEFDRGAYNYRNSASDSEEFGDDEPSWSDDENRKPYS